MDTMIRTAKFDAYSHRTNCFYIGFELVPESIVSGVGFFKFLE